MKRLFRDILAGALGANLTLLFLSVMLHDSDLMLLGLISITLCGLGLNFSTWADDEDKDTSSESKDKREDV